MKAIRELQQDIELFERNQHTIADPAPAIAAKVRGLINAVVDELAKQDVRLRAIERQAGNPDPLPFVPTPAGEPVRNPLSGVAATQQAPIKAIKPKVGK